MYLNYNKDDAKKILKNECGWEDYGGHNIENRLNAFSTSVYFPQNFNIDLIKSITENVNVPVIAHGGAGNVNDLNEVVRLGNASAVAMGSIVVYQKKILEF